MRKHLLNVVVAALGAFAWWHFAGQPVLALVRLGNATEWTMLHDLGAYFPLAATLLELGGRYAGYTFCILGIACALSSILGFEVSPLARQRARTAFSAFPLFCFFMQLFGAYMLQSWCSTQGILFPANSFLGSLPDSAIWLGCTWVITAPAIRKGRGWFALSGKLDSTN